MSTHIQDLSVAMKLEEVDLCGLMTFTVFLDHRPWAPD